MYQKIKNISSYCNTSLYMDGNSIQSTMIDHQNQLMEQCDSISDAAPTKPNYQSNSVHASTNNNHHNTNNYPSSKKRKYSYNECSDDPDDDGCDDAKSVKTTDDNKKQNHSEIEKRRRDKMNTYISELSAMIPMCHAMSRKLDKLTVLRMTVQHLKQISGAVQSYTEGHYKPSFLTEQELKMLILQAAEGFLFVVGCDRGRILYVSESVSKGDLLGQSWFDILHPKDVSKVKEQLSSSDLSPREKLIDAKTMLPVKTDVIHGGSRLCPGARRSFFCRMKYKVSGGNNNSQIQIKEEVDSSSTNQTSSSSHHKKFVVVQCTGYLKSWAPAKIGLEEHQESSESDADSYNLSCLVALGRIQPNIYQQNLNAQCPNPNLRNIQFISRHALDGKFLFVDQRATPVLGFLPQELLGTSMYEYYHHSDIPVLAESHKAALQGTEQVTTPIYQLKAKDGSFVRIQSQWKSFRNPWTKEIEYLIAKNNIILSDMGQAEPNYQQAQEQIQQQQQNQQQTQQGQNSCQNFEFFNQIKLDAKLQIKF
uniref:CSON003702 protein n=1 Tax=Culicoides sonorensis TaxID=179676 RepID=A0A336LW47_CULSO